VPSIGIDCEVILDGTGYFLKPGSYQLKQPRVRHMSYRADRSLAYIDYGPGKRTWSMVVLAHNDLLRYDGLPSGMNGQQYRDALRTSFTNSVGTTINFVDPLNGSPIPVHFDAYNETILDLHTQIISLSTGGPPAATYEISIELLEA
jgi:hypothetical protein